MSKMASMINDLLASQFFWKKRSLTCIRPSPPSSYPQQSVYNTVLPVLPVPPVPPVLKIISMEKGKKSAEDSGRPALDAEATVSSRYTTLGVTESVEEDEIEWPWQTLAESSVGSQPAVFTADGNYFFSVVGSAVRIYSVATRKVISTLSSSSIGSSASRVANGGHSDIITSAILNPEDPFQLLTASLDGDIKVWNFLDAVLIQTIRIGNPISHMCAHDKLKGQVFIAVPTKQSKIGSSSLRTGNTLIYRVSLTPKNSTSPEHCRPAEIVRIGKTKAAAALGISASGSWLVVIAGHKAYVSPTCSPESGFTKFVSPEDLTCLAFHPSEDYFATGDRLGQIRLWYCLSDQLTSGATGERKAQTTTMHWHAHAVSSLAFTRNGAYLLSGGEESVLVIWQLETGKKEFVPRLGSPILTISIRKGTENEEEYLLGLADGSYLFVSSGSLTVTRAISRIRIDPRGVGRPPHTVVPLVTHRQTSNLILPASHPSSLQIYSPSTSALSELEVSSTNRVSRRDENEIEASRVDYVAVSASGEWMATVDSRGNEEAFSAEVNLKIWKWDASTWVLNTRIEHPHGSESVVAMGFLPQPEGKASELLMTAGLDGNVKTWCIRSTVVKGGATEDLWMNRSILTFRAGIPSDACWSPDGSVLAVSFGRQIALYNPYSNALLDCITTIDIRNIDLIRFVGRTGKYILASGRNNAVLWDLISRTVCWHFYTPSTIAQALAHPNEDLVALIIQPYVEDDAIRSSKILHFTPDSSKPFDIRTLPFRFRVVDWDGVNDTSRSFIGITYSWDIVVCGDDITASLGKPPREIDSAYTTSHRRTVFQDIFGKSSFLDISEHQIRRPTTLETSGRATGSKQAVMSLFDVPTYLAPPLETLYPSLVTSFLSKLQTQVEPQPAMESEGPEDVIIDSQVTQSLLPNRSVEGTEVDSLINLFRKHTVDPLDGPNRTGNFNGVVNGIHKVRVNGLQSDTPSRTSARKSVHVGGTNDDAHHNAHALDMPPRPSAPMPVMAGKKRKKSTL